MKKMYFIIVGIILITILTIIYLTFFNKNYFIKINYEDLNRMISEKESFILCLTQTTCLHCENYKPKLEDVANTYKINIYYIEMDLLNEKETKDFKNILSYTGTPTTVFFINGKEKTAVNRLNGDVSKEKIIKKIKSNGFIE